jgi:hypothetical protein
MVEQPRQPIIADRVEASLNVGGRLLFLGGFLVAVFAGPVGIAVLAVGIALFALYLVRVNARLGLTKTNRRVLRRWVGNGALYRSLITIRDGHDGSIPPT